MDNATTTAVNTAATTVNYTATTAVNYAVNAAVGWKQRLVDLWGKYKWMMALALGAAAIAIGYVVFRKRKAGAMTTTEPPRTEQPNPGQPSEQPPVSEAANPVPAPVVAPPRITGAPVAPPTAPPFKGRGRRQPASNPPQVLVTAGKPLPQLMALPIMTPPMNQTRSPARRGTLMPATPAAAALSGAPVNTQADPAAAAAAPTGKGKGKGKGKANKKKDTAVETAV